MKRVLQVVNHMGIGGIQAFIMNVYRVIDKEKYQFDFLVNRHVPNSYEEEIAQMGGRIFVTPARNKGLWKNKLELEHFFASHKEYCAIHMHESSLSYIEPLIVAKKIGFNNLIIHSHSTGVNNSLIHKALHRYNQTRIQKYADWYIACGELAKDWMYGKSKIYDNSIIITNGIDIDKYSFDKTVRQRLRNELDLEENFVIGHIGRFSNVKNHLFLLKIFLEVLKKKTDVKLVLVGDGELKESIKNKASEMGILDNVLFLGARNDVHCLVQAMDCFVMPSFYEGFPVTVIEAEASGLPVVMSDTITKEVLLKDNVKMCSLQSDPKIWADTIIGNQERIVDNTGLIQSGLSIQNTVQKLEKIYDAGI